MKQSAFDPDEQQRDTASKIVAGLERISEVFKVLLWEKATATSLSPIQIQILIFTAYHKPHLCNVSHLAREFNITKPTVSDAIKVLEEKGLIRKEPSEEDRRSYSIFLTPECKKLAGTLAQFSYPLKKQVDQLGDAEIKDLWAILSRLIYQLNRTGILTVQRTCYGCRYYDKRTGDSDYCQLLEKELFSVDIRLDCPEFEEKE